MASTVIVWNQHCLVGAFRVLLQKQSCCCHLPHTLKHFISPIFVPVTFSFHLSRFSSLPFIFFFHNFIRPFFHLLHPPFLFIFFYHLFLSPFPFTFSNHLSHSPFCSFQIFLPIFLSSFHFYLLLLPFPLTFSSPFSFTCSFHFFLSSFSFDILLLRFLSS